MNNIRRGWCPSLFKPMETGDGFLCRIKPFFGSVTSDQAQFVAGISEQYGNGYINLSQKGNLQLRGFTRENIDLVIPQVIKAQLSSDTANMEEKRNIMISPLWDIDPLRHVEVYDIAQELQIALQNHPDIHPLTGKFSFLISGGEQYGLQKIYNDVNIRAYKDQWIVQLGKFEQVILCEKQQLVPLILEIMQFCIHHQIKRLLESQNAEQYLKECVYPTIYYKNIEDQHLLPLGFVELSTISFVHIGVPFGLINAGQLSDLANFAEQYGNGTMRFTPWRSIILPDCEQEALEKLGNFITDDHDPRLHITLCPGKPSCIQGQQATMRDVFDLIPIWKNQKQILHLSGCAKGCASPGINPVTLSATADGYNLILNGKADQKPSYRNLKLTEILNLLQTEFCNSH
ncbi:precorrin-3B synthase [Commensalibacter papalotli (ex Servin-Garciduenas et al. 2014)]|uniref:Cobalamin biosynthesis protein precorrin-3B biosynthesis protein n=1 Tax=Commensalibacter papalotli (ex Servin-Garciduenas et al. 2014) TaxID=1208583 RepID=W7DTQ1_9PROT|nr:precorrin-3B synthase [Commensalibacter papalotli (ex Servin-Garciduenas et al. 2014)]EUK17638.1 cobalamin biosynthesis protein precorrin-3B biosynthesis protein [Commensalibacter papalotli (ex Servin-Garciduenas et al. 2014)]